MHARTIDTNMTNSRVLLWKNDELIEQVETNVGFQITDAGFRNTSVNSHNGALVQAIKKRCKKY